MQQDHLQQQGAGQSPSSSSSPSSSIPTTRTQRHSLLLLPSLLLSLLLLLLTIPTPTTATATPLASIRFPSLFTSRGASTSLNTQDAALHQNNNNKNTNKNTRNNAAASSSLSFSTTETNQKWDTGRFLRAVVDAQVAQVREEVGRVRALIVLPPGVINTERTPDQIAEQVGKLAVDVGFGYLQSAALGYVFGFGGALMADDQTKKVYARFLGRRAPHMKGIKQAKQFGEFCAAFTAFEGLLHVSRGINDKWNGILGSTAVGVYTMKRKAWPARLKNGATFGMFNLVLSGLGGGNPKQQEAAKVGAKNAGGKGQGVVMKGNRMVGKVEEGERRKVRK